MGIEERIRKAVREKIEIVEFDEQWAAGFNSEKKFLEKAFPNIIIRIEHFGSTAIPGMAAKPVVDMLIEVTSLQKTRDKIAPALEKLGYEYFWRTDVDPPYAWFIKRNDRKLRSHHLHMVEADSIRWEALFFRDYLIEFPEVARKYGELKQKLAKRYPNDREAYTKGKDQFVAHWTRRAKKYYKAGTNS